MHADSGKRAFDLNDFGRAYEALVVRGVFQEDAHYYRRYRNRYQSLIATYAALRGTEALDVLEVGGGQHALLAHALFADRATVADLRGCHLDFLASHGVATAHWDLLADLQPFEEAFDRIFLCEVMGHVPVPPYQYLSRLRVALRPGGVLIVSTPNLHRLRNIALLVAGQEPFDRFGVPAPGTWRGRFLDFSASHLQWQLEQAGFGSVIVERCEFGHRATTLPARLGNLVLRPLTTFPHFRYTLVATAVRPYAE